MVSLEILLRVSVVVMLMSVKPSESKNCGRTLLKDTYGCRYYQLSLNNTLCVVDSFSSPDFFFYIKPGNHFNKLVIRMPTEGAVTGGSYTYYDFEIERTFLPSSEEWYKIHLSSELGQYFGLSRAYNLYINDQKALTKWLTFTRASVFTVRIDGSRFYSKQCIPDLDLSPLKGPKDFPSWLISVIVGVAFMIIIVAIVIAVVMSKKWKAKKEDKTSDVNEERDICNTISNDPDRHTRDPGSFNFNESDDPANHIYEEIKEYNISIDVIDQRDPVTFVNDNAGQSVSHHHATPGRHHILNQQNNSSQSSRESVHVTENSFYRCIRVNHR